MRSCPPELADTFGRRRVLPAANRLRRAEDYRTTARRGVRAGRPLIVVQLLVDHPMLSSKAALSPNDDEPVRVGFTVGRSVGGAVIRNAVRRRLRHLMRDRLASLPAGSQVVVRAQPAAATVPSAVLAAELDDALTRAINRAAGKLDGRTAAPMDDASAGRVDSRLSGRAGERR